MAPLTIGGGGSNPGGYGGGYQEPTDEGPSPPPVGDPPPDPTNPGDSDPLAGIPDELIKAFFGSRENITKQFSNPQAAADFLKPFVEPYQSKNWQKLFETFTRVTGTNPSALLTSSGDAGTQAILWRLGFKPILNAEGKWHGKLTTPDGRGVDVIYGAGGDPDQMHWQWFEDAGPPGGGGSWWDKIPAPDPYTSPDRPDWLKGPFEAPTQEELENSPGYAARMAAAQRGFERGAAAKGSILSGGTQVALSREMQNQASGEYSNLFGQRLLGRQTDEGAFQSDVSNKLNQYKQRYQAYQDAIANLYKYA